MGGRVLGTRQGPIRVRLGNEQLSVRERGGDPRNEVKAREPELESELGARADMEPPWMRASGSGLQPPERPARKELEERSLQRLKASGGCQPSTHSSDTSELPQDNVKSLELTMPHSISSLESSPFLGAGQHFKGNCKDSGEISLQLLA